MQVHPMDNNSLFSKEKNEETIAQTITPNKTTIEQNNDIILGEKNLNVLYYFHIIFSENNISNQDITNDNGEFKFYNEEKYLGIGNINKKK